MIYCKLIRLEARFGNASSGFDLCSHERDLCWFFRSQAKALIAFRGLKRFKSIVQVTMEKNDKIVEQWNRK